MDIKTVRVDIPDGANVVIGQSHFIKTVPDLYETLMLEPELLFLFSTIQLSDSHRVRLGMVGDLVLSFEKRTKVIQG